MPSLDDCCLNVCFLVTNPTQVGFALHLGRSLRDSGCASSCHPRGVKGLTAGLLCFSDRQRIPVLQPFRERGDEDPRVNSKKWAAPR